MATVVFSADGRTVSVTFAPEEQRKLNRCRTAYGDDAVGVVVLNWLEERQRHLDDIDSKDAKARRDSLTDADKAQIPLGVRAKLGL